MKAGKLPPADGNSSAGNSADAQRIQNALDGTERKALRALCDAGADRGELLTLLDEKARPADSTRNKTIRFMQSELDKLGPALDAVVSRVERLNKYAILAHPEMLEMERAPVTASELEVIRRCARYAREQASRFRAFMVWYNRKSRYNWPVFLLSSHIQKMTGKPHDKELAILLSAAYRVFGREKRFSASTIKKARQYSARILGENWLAFREPSE